MLSQLVGPIDINAAMVLIAISFALCIVITVLIAKRKSRVDTEHDFELAKMKLDDESRRALFIAETDRINKKNLVEKGLITSHRMDG